MTRASCHYGVPTCPPPCGFRSVTLASWAILYFSGKGVQRWIRMHRPGAMKRSPCDGGDYNNRGSHRGGGTFTVYVEHVYAPSDTPDTATETRDWEL